MIERRGIEGFAFFALILVRIILWDDEEGTRVEETLLQTNNGGKRNMLQRKGGVV